MYPELEADALVFFYLPHRSRLSAPRDPDNFVFFFSGPFDVVEYGMEGGCGGGLINCEILLLLQKGSAFLPKGVEIEAARLTPDCLETGRRQLRPNCAPGRGDANEY